MKTRAWRCVLAVAAVSTSVLYAPSAFAQASKAAAGDYIVETAPGISAQAVATAAGVTTTHTYDSVLHGFSATLTAAQAQSLRSNQQVVSVSVDEPIYAATTQTLTTTFAPPNTTYPQWGLDRIDQRSVTGDGKYHYDTTGAGTTVFVADSGVLAGHSEFGGRVSAGYDFVDNDATAQDCSRHGTEVASVIGGTTTGVAKAATLVPLRVLGCVDNNGITAGQGSDLIAALDWAVAHKPAGPALVNISADGAKSAVLDKAVTNTIAAGLSVVVAAGNDQGDACESSPARVPGAITVGGTDSRDWLYIASNTGPCVDLFAPADQIAVAGIMTNSFLTWDEGTSLSAAFVSGMAARELQSSPTLTPAALAAAIVASATPSAVLAEQVDSTTHAVIAFIPGPSAAPVPGKPVIGSATPGALHDGLISITANWQPPTSGGPVTSYAVRATNKATGGQKTLIVNGSARTVRIPGLKVGATYSVTVVARNASGSGVTSDRSNYAAAR